MSDNIKTATEEKIRVYEIIGRSYMSFLVYKIGKEKMDQCFNKKSFSFLSNEDLLSVKEVSEFIARTNIRAQDSLLYLLMEEDNNSAHSLITAYMLYEELGDRGLLEDEKGNNDNNNK